MTMPSLEHQFQAAVDAENKIEPKDWMPAAYRLSMTTEMKYPFFVKISPSEMRLEMRKAATKVNSGSSTATARSNTVAGISASAIFSRTFLRRLRPRCACWDNLRPRTWPVRPITSLAPALIFLTETSFWRISGLRRGDEARLKGKRIGIGRVGEQCQV